MNTEPATTTHAPLLVLCFRTPGLPGRIHSHSRLQRLLCAATRPSRPGSRALPSPYVPQPTCSKPENDCSCQENLRVAHESRLPSYVAYCLLRASGLMTAQARTRRRLDARTPFFRRLFPTLWNEADKLLQVVLDPFCALHPLGTCNFHLIKKSISTVTPHKRPGHEAPTPAATAAATAGYTRPLARNAECRKSCRRRRVHGLNILYPEGSPTARNRSSFLEGFIRAEKHLPTVSLKFFNR